jgi:hypothetical protein
MDEEETSLLKRGYAWRQLTQVLNDLLIAVIFPRLTIRDIRSA